MIGDPMTKPRGELLAEISRSERFIVALREELARRGPIDIAKHGFRIAGGYAAFETMGEAVKAAKAANGGDPDAGYLVSRVYVGPDWSAADHDPSLTTGIEE